MPDPQNSIPMHSDSPSSGQSPQPLQGDAESDRTPCLMRVRPGATSSKGRGVFATAPIARGELIEVAPALVIPSEEWHHVEPTVLALYIFNFGPVGEHAAIALGYGSLYNHSFSPNAEYLKSWEKKVIRFVALRDIATGEEVTVNYNGSPGDRSPIWFEVAEE